MGKGGDGTRPALRHVTPPAGYSGLKGKALQTGLEYPAPSAVFDAIPKSCYAISTSKSLMYAAMSTAMTLGLAFAAFKLLPQDLSFASLALWTLYAIVTGTVAVGCWVVAHECGHGAFSRNKLIQATVGYVLHSALLVPYFSWQRSHAVHHRRTNHVDEGETHVPKLAGDAKFDFFLKGVLGEFLFSLGQLVAHLLLGWPAYMLFGLTGGPKYGWTNHFWPAPPFATPLFAGKHTKWVYLSDLGVVATLAGLGLWAAQRGLGEVLALYAGPYLVVNMWLVGYTWLHHTDVDVPHFSAQEWTWMKGAFCTVDRPYGKVFDFLHHHIGSTHVAHHINHKIPHYNAVKATKSIKRNWPHLYLYDPTPVSLALWRIARDCVAVEPYLGGVDCFVYAPTLKSSPAKHSKMAA